MLAVVSLLLAFGVPPASATGARIVDEEVRGPRTITLTIETPAFATPTKVDVNLPTGYDADPARRWPTTYFLAGTMNTYRTFNTFIDGVGITKDHPSILVSPNGDSGYWSDWYNGGAAGPPAYETYVARQLIPLIDARFRTAATRAQRVVLGVSMGGYGATMMAARHPDLFSAVATLSGAVDSNLQPNGAVLSLSPTFQDAAPDAIYGPRASQEVRWRGHNPVDLADNLRTLDVQVRTANGLPAPGIGEDPLSADTVSCAVEAGVYQASVSLHRTLDAIGKTHRWKDYGAGCHTKANFTRELVDTFAAFTEHLAAPPPDPVRFDHARIEPAFTVFGWDVRADPARPLEFLRLRDVGPDGLTLLGSGTTTVTTPPLFAGVRRVDLRGADTTSVVPGNDGRLRFTVDLGPPSAAQQYTPGAVTNRVTRTVELEPHASARITSVRATRRTVRVCARTAGGPATVRVRVRDARSRPLTANARLSLGARTACRTLRRAARPTGGRLAVRVSGTDRFGHAVTARRAVRLSR